MAPWRYLSDAGGGRTAGSTDRTVLRHCRRLGASRGVPYRQVGDEHMTLLRSVDALIEEAGLTPIVRPPAPVTDTGWERIDLFPWLQGPMPDDSPKLGVRTDGVRVLYPGRIHAINGEPESGKTWLAQFLAAQELAGGHKVLYLDYEDGPAAFASRMAALGVPARIVVTALHYHRI